jgi:hypothetical protein
MKITRSTCKRAKSRIGRKTVRPILSFRRLTRRSGNVPRTLPLSSSWTTTHLVWGPKKTCPTRSVKRYLPFWRRFYKRLRCSSATSTVMPRTPAVSPKTRRAFPSSCTRFGLSSTIDSAEDVWTVRAVSLNIVPFSLFVYTKRVRKLVFLFPQ